LERVNEHIKLVFFRNRQTKAQKMTPPIQTTKMKSGFMQAKQFGMIMKSVHKILDYFAENFGGG
jgi:hypothetical protein